MDVFTMAARAGWEVFPIGGACEPDSVPMGSLMGLVLISGAPSITEKSREIPASNKPLSHARSFAARRQRLKKDINRFSANMKAMKEYNVDFKQVSRILSEAGTWIQLAKNLHELDNSWVQVMRRNARMFSGRPQKKETP